MNTVKSLQIRTSLLGVTHIILEHCTLQRLRDLTRRLSHCEWCTPSAVYNVAITRKTSTSLSQAILEAKTNVAKPLDNSSWSTRPSGYFLRAGPAVCSNRDHDVLRSILVTSKFPANSWPHFAKRFSTAINCALSTWPRFLNMISSCVHEIISRSRHYSVSSSTPIQALRFPPFFWQTL